MSTEVFVSTGVWASAGEKKQWITLREIKSAAKLGHVSLSINYDVVGLSPCEAKKLADQLYELANKAEARGK